MYALTMAAANTTMPWAQLSSYMVSDPNTNSPTEAWSWVDAIGADDAANVCAGADDVTLPLATRGTSVALPNTLHYCQRYEQADHFFGKRKVPHDFFSCDRAHLPLDVDHIIDDLRAETVVKPAKLRTAFMLCHIIPMMNSFLDTYQRDVCPHGLAHGAG